MNFTVQVVRDERSMEEYAESVAGYYLEAREDDHLFFSEPVTKDLAEQLSVAARRAQEIVEAQLNHPLAVFAVTFILLSPMLLPGGGL